MTLRLRSSGSSGVSAARIKVWRGSCPWEAPGVSLSLCLFWLLEASPFLGLWSLPPPPKPALWVKPSNPHHSDSEVCASLFQFKDPWGPGSLPLILKSGDYQPSFHL